MEKNVFLSASYLITNFYSKIGEGYVCTPQFCLLEKYCPSLQSFDNTSSLFQHGTYKLCNFSGQKFLHMENALDHKDSLFPKPTMP